MTTVVPSGLSAVPSRQHLDRFFQKVDPARGRLIFAVDATASRQQTWDAAASLQAEMFRAVGSIGGLDVQLVYYRGEECTATRWLTDPGSLAAIMSRVMCAAGQTQIGRVLVHARKEHARQKIDAVILISDACEERAQELYAQARELPVPVFAFQEGPGEQVAAIYAEIARITGGASCQFDSGAAQRLADLLRAIAAFAAGGMKALAAQQSDAARLLLAQLKQ
jgi:hypothetical protein